MKSLTKLKRVAVMLLAMLVMLTAMIPMKNISAAELTTTLRVTGMETGTQVWAYAIALDAVDSNGNHYWKYNDKGNVKGRVEDGDISADDGIYFYTHLNSTSDDADNHDGLGEATVDATVLQLKETPSGSGTYEISDVKPGLYVIASDAGSYNFMIAAVNYKYSGTGVASIADENGVITIAAKKADEPTIDKNVLDSNKKQKYGDAKIGDVITFSIEFTVPNYNDEWKETEKLHYQINDTMTPGLTLDQDSIKLVGTKFSEYSKQNENTKLVTTANGFVMDLYGADVYQYVGQTIAVTYEATVNDMAKVNFDNEKNSVYLKYSNKPGSTDLSSTDPKITYHYTFGIDTTVNGLNSDKTTEITKFGVKTTTETNNKVLLAGAKFQLSDETRTVLKFDDNGKLSTAADAKDYIVSGTNGELTATGLDAGTYYLKELTAPDGYALNNTTYKIVITPTYAADGQLLNYTVTVNNQAGTEITFTHEKLDNGTIRNTDTAADSDTFGIINTPLTTLPSTGGRGIIVVSGIAVVIMAVCGSMFMVTSRKKKDEKNC